MQIRRLETADLPNVRGRAEHFAVDYYPELISDIQKEHDLLREAVASTHYYSGVVGKPGEPKAVLIAKVSENLWSLRKHAAMLLWYSDLPGAGYKLLRDFRDWVKTQKHVVAAGFVDDFAMNDSTSRMLTRAGFTKRGGAYFFYPRGAKK